MAPLKALINDQFGRMSLSRAAISRSTLARGRSGSKKLLVLTPGGILLITPESLEALFVLHGRAVAAVRGPAYVVVDELHAFLGSERGASSSLIHRVELAIRRRVPRIGLSATLGDIRLAADALRPGGGDEVQSIQSARGGQELVCAGPWIPDQPGAAQP